MIRQLRATHRPITLTIDGRPEVVIQEAAAYKHLLDLLDEAETRKGLRRGLEDIAAGRTRPAREVFTDLREEYGIPG